MPGMAFSVPALSEKDIADLEFALALGVDLVARSCAHRPMPSWSTRSWTASAGGFR